jgi:hypothetical protein
MAPHQKTGEMSTSGWSLANRGELEAAARRWRQHVAEHGDPAQGAEALMRLLGRQVAE